MNEEKAKAIAAKVHEMIEIRATCLHDPLTESLEQYFQRRNERMNGLEEELVKIVTDQPL